MKGILKTLLPGVLWAALLLLVATSARQESLGAELLSSWPEHIASSPGDRQ